MNPKQRHWFVFVCEVTGILILDTYMFVTGAPGVNTLQEKLIGIVGINIIFFMPFTLGSFFLLRKQWKEQTPPKDAREGSPI